MNKIILVFFLLISNANYAQVKGGIITYGVTISDDADFDKGPAGDFLKLAKNAAQYLSYTLLFNENESIFCLDNIMETNQNEISAAVAFSGIYGKFFNIKKSMLLLNEFDNEDFGRIVVQKQYDYKWEFSNESKKIDGFTCFKASRIMIIDNGDSGVFKRPIIAWYCPSIPASFGPVGEGGLPGMILELHNRNVVLGVKKIDLNPLENSVILIPDRKIWITEEKYTKMMDEKMN